MASGAFVAKPLITIAVCTRNRPAQLQRWLAHFTMVAVPAHMPILIVEQSPAPTPLPQLPQVTHLHVPGRGLARARNIALATATTPFVAFCDDDCVPDALWLPTMHNIIQQHPHVAVITGSTWPSGTTYTLHAHHTQAGYTTWASRADGWCCTALRIQPDAVAVNQPVAVLESLGQGNNMVVARHIALYHGGFHVWLGAGAWLQAGEDVEFILRLLCAHQQCIYAPSMRISHDAWQTSEALAQAEHGYTVGMLAVHIWYALRGVAVARTYLRFRWQQLTHRGHAATTHPAARPRGWWWGRATAWGWGIIGGLALTVTAWWRER